MIGFALAYLAGALTLINPCVLPLLPITIAAALDAGKFGPLALSAGLVFAFTVVGVVVSAFGHILGIDAQTIIQAAAIIMMVFGLILLIGPAQTFLAILAAPLATQANARIGSSLAGGDNLAGVPGQFAIGLLLGAVWSPCIGPTLGGAIGLAASGEGLGTATVTMLSFGLGVATVLIALSYGSRGLLAARKQALSAWMPWAKPVMGVLLLLVGLLIFFHIDRLIEGWLLDLMPVWLQDLSVSL